MTPSGRPPGTPNEDEASARMRAAELAREEERHLRATNAHHREDMVSIRMRHRVHGMSRKRLIEIYGRELVDQALTS